MDAVFAMDRAKDWDAFREAAALFDVPSQNLVYADAEHIGYTLPGKIPVRAEDHDGSVPAPGWTSEYRWTGEYIDPDELPYEYDPERGYIVTANQAVVDADEYPYTPDHGLGLRHRSQRITS